MSIVVLKLPDVKSKAETRPNRCPYCKSEILQRWGKVSKPVRDPDHTHVQVYRYRCCTCRRTFRHYPVGIDQADQSLRLRRLAGLCWKLGFSYRSIAAVFIVFKVGISRMTAWRDVQEVSDYLHQKRKWQPVRVLGLDGASVRGWGDRQSVLVAVDLGAGQPVALGRVNEYDPQAVRKWLEPLVKRLGVSVIVTDDLLTYRVLAQKLGLEHQVCQFHLRRWVGRTLHELSNTVPKDWVWVVEQTQRLIKELPQDGDRSLYELWKKVAVRRRGSGRPLTALEQLRNLLIRLSENWASYRIFDWQPDVPWTNNTTEQVIGRMKMRSRTVRGYKTWEGMQAGLMLAGSDVC